MKAFQLKDFKRLNFLSLAIILLTAFCLVLTGCSDDDDDPVHPPSPTPTPAASPGTLNGTVTDAAGNAALSNVQVKIVQGTRTVAETFTNSEGKYEKTELAAGDYTVTFSLGQYDALMETAAIISEQVTTLDVAMSRTPLGSATLTGKVTAPQAGNTGTQIPLENVLVTLTPIAVEEPAPVAPVYTDKTGTYTITAPEGYYSVSYERDPYMTKTDTVTLPKDTTVTKNMIMDMPAKVIGYVFYQDTVDAVEDVTVTLKQGTTTVETTTTGVSGSYTFADTMESGAYTLEFTKEKISFDRPTVNIDITDEMTTRVTPVYAIGGTVSISARFLDGWSQTDPLSLYTDETLSMFVTTPSDQVIILPNSTDTGIYSSSHQFLTPGNYKFTIAEKQDKAGKYNYEKTVYVEPGQDVDLGDITIKDVTYFTIRGKVFRGTGGIMEPTDLSQLRVRVYPEGGNTPLKIYCENGEVLEDPENDPPEPDEQLIGTKATLSTNGTTNEYTLSFEDASPAPGWYEVAVSHIQRGFETTRVRFYIDEELLKNKNRGIQDVPDANMQAFSGPHYTTLKMVLIAEDDFLPFNTEVELYRLDNEDPANIVDVDGNSTVLPLTATPARVGLEGSCIFTITTPHGLYESDQIVDNNNLNNVSTKPYKLMLRVVGYEDLSFDLEVNEKDIFDEGEKELVVETPPIP